MDIFLHRQEPDAQKKRGFLAGLKIFKGILSFIQRSLNWLINSIKLTEKDQEDAGLFLGHLGDK